MSLGLNPEMNIWKQLFVAGNKWQHIDVKQNIYLHQSLEKKDIFFLSVTFYHHKSNSLQMLPSSGIDRVLHLQV